MREEEKEKKIKMLEAEIRALKAVISELPDVTEALIKTAKEKVRKKAKAKGRLGDVQEQLAKGGPLDREAEEILDDWAHQIKNRAE